MIGCALLTAAGIFVAARMIHRHHHGWCGGGGWRHHHHHRGGWGGHHGHWGGWGDWDGPGGEYDFDRDDGPPPFARGGGRRFFLRRLSRHLDATPAQEQVIANAIDELREAGSKVRGEGRKSRADVAGAFRRPQFDEVALGELYARHDRALEELRKAFVGAGARVHDALDDKQRARLADLIEAGRGWWR